MRCVAGALFIAALTSSTSTAALAAPETVPTTAGESLSEAERVQIRSFRFTGNTLFSSVQLSEVLKAYQGREVTTEELETARRLLTQFYIDRGYVNSGATLPDQKVSNGVITFNITEGRLTELQIAGSRYFRRGFLRQKIAPEQDKPLNLLSLRDRLQLLRQNENIERIAADVRPGTRPGEAILAVDIEENRPYGATLEFDNSRPPSVGAERLSLTLHHRNLTGWDDTFSLRTGLTHDDLKLHNPLDPRDLAVSYRSPEFGSATRLLLSYSKGDSAVIEAPFQDLDISSRSQNYSFGLQKSLQRTLNRDLGVSLIAEHRESASFLSGVPFSFSEGDVNGVSETTALRLGVDYLQRDAGQVFAARILTSYGGNFPGSTKNDEAPNGRFLTFLGQAQFVRSLDEKGRRLVLRVDGQWSNRSLLSVEKFVIGGAGSVRGYRENQLVRDRGLAASAEFRYPLVYDKLGRDRLVLAPFFDIGIGKNINSSQNTGGNTLSSLGLGLLYNDGGRLSGQIYYGYALKDVGNANRDLQDRGIHFALSLRL